ncbi:MAG: hypothetical protein KDK89_01905 [Alphaproteobacteria bacterium]|nr:hypothetical protein [Alphaproteobacteria bacterium]
MLSRLALVLLLSCGFAAGPIMATVDTAVAATTKKKIVKKKKTVKSRSQYTAEERQRILEYAIKLCKKKYGASSSVYRIDYSKPLIWCAPPGL